MMDPSSAELFPLEAVLLGTGANTPEKWPQRLEQWLEAFENSRSSFSSQYGPLPFPEDSKRPMIRKERWRSDLGCSSKPSQPRKLRRLNQDSGYMPGVKDVPPIMVFNRKSKQDHRLT